VNKAAPLRRAFSRRTLPEIFKKLMEKFHLVKSERCFSKSEKICKIIDETLKALIQQK
jgi:hypothetical protein